MPGTTERRAEHGAPRSKAVAELARLRPTQLTLGYAHVNYKMDVTQRHADPDDHAALRRFMRRHRIWRVGGKKGGAR